MAREVSYIERSEHSADLAHLRGPEDWTDEFILPGDLIFCRHETAPTTRLIERLDGFFSHVGIYVGDGKMAHSFSQGVAEWDLTSDFVAQYSCLAVGRPKAASLDVRQAVAAFAADQVRLDEEAIPFGAFDLGQTFALLARAKLFFWRRYLPKPSAVDIDGAIERAQEILDAAADADEVVTSTCAGFSWRSWSHAGSPLTPNLVKGTMINDDLMKGPGDELSVLEWLLDGAPFDAYAIGQSLLSSEELDKYMKFAGLARDAFPGLTGMLNVAKAVPLHEAVAPGDLWCSPSLEHRMFLNSESKERAVAA